MQLLRGILASTLFHNSDYRMITGLMIQSWRGCVEYWEERVVYLLCLWWSVFFWVYEEFFMFWIFYWCSDWAKLWWLWIKQGGCWIRSNHSLICGYPDASCFVCVDYRASGQSRCIYTRLYLCFCVFFVLDTVVGHCCAVLFLPYFAHLFPSDHRDIKYPSFGGVCWLLGRG